MTRLLKLETMTFLAFLSWRMVETSQGLARGLGGFAPITFVTALLLTIGAGLFRAIRNE